MKWILTLLLLVITIQINSQHNLQISLLSCSPGSELYSTFGHSAIRIKNLHTSDDTVYNYGTFSFSDKNFYLKFLSGKLNYYLTVSSYDRFIREYTIENRSVYEQVFALDSLQANQLYRDLQINALPENRAYKYDFFWDNCSTRIRDIIKNQYGDKLSYPTFTIKPFRAYLHDYLQNQPWSKFGIDLILGLPCDAPATTKEAMFLPMEMMKAYDGTSLFQKPIASQSKEILTSVPLVSGKHVVTPILIASVLLSITIVLSLFKRIYYWSNLILVICGIGGCIIFFLWFLADHLTTKNNLHLIWAHPLLLLYPFRKKLFKESTLTVLSIFYAVVLIGLLLTFPVNYQKMPLACIPIWLSLLIVIARDIKGVKLFNLRPS